MFRHALWVIFAGISVFAGVPGALVPMRVGGTSHTLLLPPGFQISEWASLESPRFMALLPNGDILVSQPSLGRVTLLRPDAAGGAPKSYTYASGLRSPHDVVFDTIGDSAYVYVGESNQIVRYAYTTGDTSAHGRQVLVSGLPDNSTVDGYAHPFKNFAIDSQHRLYVAIASSCNVCLSDTTATPVRGSIYQYNADGSSGRLYARGLRNAEGVRFLPGTDSLYVVINNRDNQPYPVRDSTNSYGKVLQSYVDNHPPDLFTLARAGGNYGWPFCNSNPDSGYDNMPFLPDFEMNASGQTDCSRMDIPSKGIQAHSAPLGLTFLQNTQFPAPYRDGAVVGLHGSWNRAAKTGYKIIYYPFESSGNFPGAQIDFVAGFLESGEDWGRPVQAVVDSTGALLISDDGASVIYRMTYSPSAVSSASGVAWGAPESLASIYGSNLTSDKVTVRDSAGVARAAVVSYATPSQINFQIPAGTAPGNASLLVGEVAVSGLFFINPVAPGVFSANGNGKGVAAATATRRVIPTNFDFPVPVFQCTVGGCKPFPIDVGIDAPVTLSLYATGVRGVPIDRVKVTIAGIEAPVLYAGPQGQYPGLDQVNVPLLLSLRGAGEVDVVLLVDGQPSNTVRIAIQ